VQGCCAAGLRLTDGEAILKFYPLGDARSDGPQLDLHVSPCRVLLSIGSALLSAQSASAQDPTWAVWGKPLADKLLTFVPAPPPGLVHSVPWTNISPPRADEGRALCWTGDRSGCALFYGVSVVKEWLIYDSALVARVVELKRRGDSLAARVSRQTPQDELNKIWRQTAAIGPESDRLKRSLGKISFTLTANATPAHWFDPDARPISAIKG